ncbi:hypothetical protein [Nostoc sp. ATCC 53789]|nr:hypothetical protein [Nostoc sp. ATCC 53789]QHG16063.1 hypothetical protein GJB62_08790 [Nostoc sp. ATCC 53789]
MTSANCDRLMMFSDDCPGDAYAYANPAFTFQKHLPLRWLDHIIILAEIG